VMCRVTVCIGVGVYQGSTTD